jgi:hypothetical protein
MKKAKKTLNWLLSACMVVLGSVGAAEAHHNAASQYEVQKAIRFTGVLTSVEFTNPHAHMRFDVKGSDGSTQSWLIEFLSVRGLRTMGITKDLMKLGDTYTLTISPARDGRPNGLIQTLTFPDGRVFRITPDV